MIADTLLKTYPIISDQVEPQELRVVLAELESLLANGRHGSIVEFGCYIGSTSVFVQRLLTNYNSDSTYHVFDSFEGLPEKTLYDASPVGEQFKAGELLASKKQFIATMKRAGMPVPTIHKGWFSDLTPADVPTGIMFAFLDGDYYESITTSLRLIQDKLTEDAVIIVDDYANEALPGAARAVDEWIRHQGRYTLRTQSSLAVIRKK